MDCLYEKLEGPDADKHVFRLARARHRATMDIAEVRCVKDGDGTTLFNPSSVRERWNTVTQQLLEEPPFSLLYAEDIALLADTRNQLQRKVQMGQDTLAKASLKPNVKKTEFLSTGRDVEPITDVNGVAILQVNKFRYLGNILSEDGSVDMAVQETITSA
ncbi:hypothetical protein ANCCEY_07676 [Ancylostoma ceylanicum]|uniref:Reverse transcriptase domain-containing protein n=1 Tax=Ancylostoma ceylanicum TaxID=53326 RepID=A0A0D6LT65_9BILA|nr:hypothetical protein ANCCEY_07676 [Ancylostoma ceylanicum]